jgi:hypothetical protein
MDKRIRQALEETGLEWNIEPGKKHLKIRVAGHLAGVLPHGKHSETDRRSILNTVRQIRAIRMKLSIEVDIDDGKEG